MKYTESNKPLVCMQTQSTCYKGTSKMTPKGVLWHSTGANNPTLKRYVQPSDVRPVEDTYSKEEWLNILGKNQYNNDWNHIDRQAGLNAWIGKLADGTITAVQTMPWDFKPWGCGAGSKGSCNSGWMQFEICEDDLTNKEYFEAVYKEACELTAYYCKMYNLDPRGTVSHAGVQVPVILDHITSYELGLGGNHGDIRHWLKKYNKTLDDIRNDVANLMGLKNVPIEDGKIDGKYVKGKKVKLAANFTSNEFDCHGKGCCSETLVDQNLVNYLQKIRTHFNKSVNISSGYRCATHNKSIGGATGSYHTKGQAADIYITGVAPIEIARYAESIGIKGIGLYETEADGYFVHVDTRASKSFWYGQGQAYRSTFQEKKEEVPTIEKAENSEAKFAEGDLVSLAKDAVYYNGKDVPDWVVNQKWYVKSVSGDRAVIDESENKKSHINSPINIKYLTKVEINKVVSRPTLRLGSVGEDVKILQTKLKELGFDCSGIDGSFGAKTQAQVLAFQKERNLDKDGVCGPKTWKAIDESVYQSMKVTASALNVRSGPGTSYSIKSIVKKDSTHVVVYTTGDWGKLKDGAGWVSLKYMTKI